MAILERHVDTAAWWSTTRRSGPAMTSYVEKMLLEIDEQAPWKTWFSPVCVLQGTEPGTPAAARKKQMKVKYQLDNVNRLTEGILEGGGHRHVCLEMPSTSASWGTAAIRKFKTLLGQRGSVFRTLIDGCMVGMSSGTGIPIKKQFTVMTGVPREDACSVRPYTWTSRTGRPGPSHRDVHQPRRVP